MIDWHRIFLLRRKLNGLVARRKWQQAYILAAALDELLGVGETRQIVVPLR